MSEVRVRGLSSALSTVIAGLILIAAAVLLRAAVGSAEPLPVSASPATVFERPWLVTLTPGSAVVGVGLTGTTIALGDGERAVGLISEGLVVARPTDTGADTTVRNGQGSLELAAVPLLPTGLTETARGIYVTGLERGSARSDPGLFLVDPETGTTVVVIEPEATPSKVGPVLYRTVAASPDGGWIVSGLCEDETCAVDIVDARGTSRGRVTDTGIPVVVGASVFMTLDHAAGVIEGYDMSGALVWRRSGSEFQHTALYDDDRALLGYVGGDEGDLMYRVELVDLKSGKGRELSAFAVGELALWPELSGPGAAVLGPAYSLAEGLGRGTTTVTILDPTIGQVTKDAATVVMH